MSKQKRDCKSVPRKIINFQFFLDYKSFSSLNLINAFFQALTGQDCELNDSNNVETSLDKGYFLFLSKFYKCINYNTYQTFSCAREYVGLDGNSKTNDIIDEH